MTQLQDESRAENWALFQLKSMKANIAALHRAKVSKVFIVLLEMNIKDCEDHIKLRQKERARLKAYKVNAENLYLD